MAVQKEHGHISGVTNLVGSVLIKPLHVTTQEEVHCHHALPNIDAAPCPELGHGPVSAPELRTLPCLAP